MTTTPTEALRALHYRLSGCADDPAITAADAYDEHYRAMVREALTQPVAALPAPSGEPAEHVRPMTAERALYFMERFRREEKLLGPNEQAAVDFVIAMLEAAQAAPAPQGNDHFPDAGNMVAPAVAAPVQPLTVLAHRLADELRDCMCSDCKPSDTGASCCMPGARAVLEDARTHGIAIPAKG